MEKRPPGAGRSSFGLIDRKILFNELHLMSGISLLDLGCGRGEYVLAAAKFIGEEGRLYGIDPTPLTTRLAPEEANRIVTPHGFMERRAVEVGPYSYLITFSAREFSQRR